jgi:hypothetical protein
MENLIAAEMYRVRICKPFEEPRNRFPAWRASTAILFNVPAPHIGYMGWRNRFLAIDSLESIPGLPKCLQIWAQFRNLCTLSETFDSPVLH